MKKIITFTWILVLALAACAPAGQTATPQAEASAPSVLAVETFLADIAQNVAGDRLLVQALLPTGVDPHAFEATSQDVARIADSQVLIINGGGAEEWMERILENAGGERLVIEASTGLTSREPGAGEPVEEHEDEEEEEEGHEEGDPHFWMNPVNVIAYVENIRDGLIQADPAGEQDYTRNAAAYIEKLQELDAWIQAEVAQIPPERRLLVTDHESLGYFADHYGFTLVGAIIPSVSTIASPSAQQLAELTQQIESTGAPAIFLQIGASPQLAEQLAAETGARVVTGLFTDSLSDADGPAPTYLVMMRYNVSAIVEALK